MNIIDERLIANLGIPVYENIVVSEDLRLALGAERFARFEHKYGEKESYTVWNVLEFLKSK